MSSSFYATLNAGDTGAILVCNRQINSLNSQFFVSTHAPFSGDCGCDSNNNNTVSDPISPANGNVSDRDTDIPTQGSTPQSSFQRFYNSADPGSTDLGVGWRHSFSRQIVPVFLQTAYQLYSETDPRDSSLNP